MCSINKLSFPTILAISFLIQSCDTLQIHRTPSAAAPSKCTELIRRIILPSEQSSNSITPHMTQLIQANISSKKDLKELLDDPIYKNFIFKHEKPHTLDQSALIVDLIRKQNPEWSPSVVTRRYKLLFNTCGI